ncbi:MAG: TonB-dependent receptor, partial [Flavobacteriaceae bacterium]|nr:TonB-dependent receptor [Flavobacteriaceae bacterium]
MIKKILLFTFLIITTFSFAQRTNSSPYSFFGIGDQAQLKSVEEIGMGLMGGALSSEYQLSFTNPASYASLKWTTYVFSGGNKATTIDDGNESQTSSAASLTYIAMGIPIRGNQGLAFGLQLNTAVGYSLLDQTFEDVEGENTLVETNLLTGEGGTNRVFFGYGYKFPFNLNLGLEVAYVFGGIENSILNRRLGVHLATKHKTDSYVKGFSYKLGAQYSKDITSDLKLKIGISAEMAHELNENGKEQLFSLINIGDESELPIDTLTSVNYTAKIKHPIKTTLSAGLGQDNKWFIGADYTFRDALDFEGGIYNNVTSYHYKNSSTVSFGGFYIPKFNSISNYWNRVTYRAGVNYKELGLVINDTDINEYGMSFGVSLPMGLRISNVNLGFELGKRGTTDNNLVKENFYNFRLSLSLNDKWFRKQKIY